MDYKPQQLKQLEDHRRKIYMAKQLEEVVFPYF